MNSEQTWNPNGGVCNRRGVEKLSSGFHQGAVGENLLPGYGPVIMVKRPVRSRMQGVVGAGGEKPPATRLLALRFAWMLIHES